MRKHLSPVTLLLWRNRPGLSNTNPDRRAQADRPIPFYGPRTPLGVTLGACKLTRQGPWT